MKQDRLLVTLTKVQAGGILSGVAALVDDGFSNDDARRTTADLTHLHGDNSLLIEPVVRIRDACVPFILDAYPTHAPAVCEGVFMTAEPLTSWLEERLRALVPPAKVKVLRA